MGNQSLNPISIPTFLFISLFWGLAKGAFRAITKRAVVPFGVSQKILSLNIPIIFEHMIGYYSN